MNKSIRLLFVMLVLFLITPDCLAQDDAAESEKNTSTNTNRKYKNEVGIDISPFSFILGTSSGGYGSFFFRRHFTKDRAVKGLSGVNKTTFHAYRIRLGTNFSFEKFSLPNIKDEFIDNYFSYYNTSNSLNSYLFIRLGQERQFRSGKFELLLGYDFFTELNISSTVWLGNQTYNVGQTNQYYFNQQWGYTNKDIRFGVAGIGGFKYFLIPRLCFSVEGTFNFGYLTGSKKNFYKSYNSSSAILEDDSQQIKVGGFRVHANPLFVVNIGYYFK